jgi:SAM-dependent methyltransferase
MDESNPIEWGNAQALKLWEGLYARYNLALDHRIIVDWGCSWGYFLKFLHDSFRPRMLIGTDIEPHWERYRHEWNYATARNITFIAGDLSAVDVPFGGNIDYIFCTSVLQYIKPSQLVANIAKAYSLLRPGGELIGRIRTYGSYIGLDGHQHFDLPYVHLLSNRREMADFLARKGQKLRYLNYLTPSSYFAMFAQAGFEVLDHRRRMNSANLPNTKDVLAKFPWIDPQELNCAEIEVRLVRPIEEYEIEHLRTRRVGGAGEF